MNVKMIKGKRIVCVAAAASLALAMTCTPGFASENQVKNIKDETVYIVTDDKGVQNDIIVSDHIKNKNSDDMISDKSNLKNIENVKGEEKFKKGENEEIIWNSKGRDIYYQGEAGDSVPVSINVKYYLNDKEVKGSELEGKSGKVKIKIEYQNEKDVPFAAVTGMIAEDSSFKNVEINSGKVIDDGEKQFIVGMAFPGLADSLNISSEELGFSDTVEITGDADGFSAKDMMSIVTNDFLDDIDGSFKELNLDGQISALDKSAKQLLEGTDTLYQGVSMLNDNKDALTNGVNSLNTGTRNLSSGIKSTMDGSKRLADGTKSLSENLNSSLGEMKDGSEKLQSGSKNLYDGILKVKSGIDGESSAAPGLLSGAESVVSGLGEAKQYLDKSLEQNNAAADYLEVLHKDGKLNDDEYGKLVQYITESKSYQEGVASKMADDGSLKSGAKAVASGINNIKTAFDGNGTSQNPGLVYGSKSLYEGTKSLKDGLYQATADSDSLTFGAQTLVKGADELLAGEQQVNSGAEELAFGMNELNKKSSVFAKGISQLDIGSKTLNEGMKKFYSEAIEKIVSLYNDDLKGKSEDLKQLIKNGKDYNNFSGISGDMDGSVKFIYRTRISQ
ncbi:MAG: hypothetical protein ACLSAO_03785 [Anaerovoracaceae bacterium]